MLQTMGNFSHLYTFWQGLLIRRTSKTILSSPSFWWGVGVGGIEMVVGFSFLPKDFGFKSGTSSHQASSKPSAL